MRLKKSYILLLIITIAVIILCFFLPSNLFKIYDQEWTDKRVEKSANTSTLNIDSMTLNEKIEIVNNLDQIESALNDETSSYDAMILSRGYKLTKSEAWNQVITEFMKLGEDLETLMPEFYKFLSSIGNYQQALNDTIFDADSVLPILVTDQNGNSTILWIVGFGMDSNYMETSEADYPQPYIQLYYDESSGYILGAEIYDLNINNLENVMTLLDEKNIFPSITNEDTAEVQEETRAVVDGDEVETIEIGSLPIENLIGRIFLKRYIEYIGWSTDDSQVKWNYDSKLTTMTITEGSEELTLSCNVLTDLIDIDGDTDIMTIHLNKID